MPNLLAMSMPKTRKKQTKAKNDAHIWLNLPIFDLPNGRRHQVLHLSSL